MEKTESHLRKRDECSDTVECEAAEAKGYNSAVPGCQCGVHANGWVNELEPF